MKTTRAEQYRRTRQRIIEAAAEAFSELGFHGASTRDIAERAGTNQGLVTYHFSSKEELWRAAADRIFSLLAATLAENAALLGAGEPRERAREVIRQYVRFVAAHPELFRWMVEEGRQPSARMRWLVDTHLKPLYAGFARVTERYLPQADATLMPHAYHALAGAASLIFAVGPECRRLTGLRPDSRQAIEAHAEFVARLFVS